MQEMSSQAAVCSFRLAKILARAQALVAQVKAAAAATPAEAEKGIGLSKGLQTSRRQNSKAGRENSPKSACNEGCASRLFYPQGGLNMCLCFIVCKNRGLL
mmetsp:Transcript_25028/g.59516  ORF Transcript_25028/g.59516 Transcript_25028/m.59516 type:complete len:101 (+) Transcript_25028:859-1161(+)